jgi:hypothetical protein
MSDGDENPPGERCDYCGRHYLSIWRAPDDVWYRVTGLRQSGLMCISCFDALARRLGIGLYWSCECGRYPDEEAAE